MLRVPLYKVLQFFHLDSFQFFIDLSSCKKMKWNLLFKLRTSFSVKVITFENKNVLFIFEKYVSYFVFNILIYIVWSSLVMFRTMGFIGICFYIRIHLFMYTDMCAYISTHIFKSTRNGSLIKGSSLCYLLSSVSFYVSRPSF